MQATAHRGGLCAPIDLARAQQQSDAQAILLHCHRLSHYEKDEREQRRNESDDGQRMARAQTTRHCVAMVTLLARNPDLAHIVADFPRVVDLLVQRGVLIARGEI